MSFPKRKFIFFKDGWIDLEEIGFETETIEGRRAGYQTHDFCKSRLRIGKEKGKRFKYCPRCLVKVVKLIDLYTI